MFRLKHTHWFQTAAVGITCIFFGLMVLVTFLAYIRPSGSTGLDMAKVQMMRYDKTTTDAAKKF
jgi:hypothetical protein